MTEYDIRKKKQAGAWPGGHCDMRPR